MVFAQVFSIVGVVILLGPVTTAKECDSDKTGDWCVGDATNLFQVKQTVQPGSGRAKAALSRRHSKGCPDDENGVSMAEISTNEKHEIVMSSKVFCAHRSKEHLGHGGSSSVAAGFDKARHLPLALKTYLKDDDTHTFDKEIAILAHLRKAPHIVNLYGVDAGYPTAPHVVAMEKLEGGDLLKNRMKHSWKLKDVAKVMKQVVQSVDDCHSNHVAHRDVKPENLMFHKSAVASNGRDIDGDTPVKLIDFGSAKWLEGSEGSVTLDKDTCDGKWTSVTPVTKGDNLKAEIPMGTWSWVATPEYDSPELAINRIKHGEKQKCDSFSMYAPDVWGIGMTAFALATKQFPPWLDECRDRVNSVKKRKVDEATGKCVNKALSDLRQESLEKEIATMMLQTIHHESTEDGMHALDFIRKTLQVDPSKRATTKELLQSPWFSSL